MVLGNVLTEPAEGDIITMGNISGATLNATNVSVADSISCATLNADNISVAPNLNITASIGKAKLGYIANFYQHAGFCHVNQNNTSGYALLHTNDGATHLNALVNKAIHFSISNQVKMILKSNGYVGIGTVNPRVNLDVANSINFASWGTYFDATNNWVPHGAIHGTLRSHQTHPVSIMCNGILSWQGFYAASDARFKTNIKDINDSSHRVLWICCEKLNQKHMNILIKLKEGMARYMVSLLNKSRRCFRIVYLNIEKKFQIYLSVV